MLWYDLLLVESSLKLGIVIILKCGRCMRTKQDNHNRNQHLYLVFMQLKRISQLTRKCLVLHSLKEFRMRPEFAPSWYREYYTVARRYEFYFEVAKQYFTNECSERVKYCFCHEKITFISSSHRRKFFGLIRNDISLFYIRLKLALFFGFVLFCFFSLIQDEFPVHYIL